MRPRFTDGTAKRALPWPQKHAPATLVDVAINNAKLAELRAAITPQSDAKVVIVSGPPGASKSTTVRLIGEDLGLNIVEYVDPESSEGGSASFEEFLCGAAFYDRDCTLVVVEDLPNLFHEDTCTRFNGSILEWALYSTRLPLLVVCITEIEAEHYQESLVVSRVLGSVLDEATVRWVKVNSVSTSVLLKCMKKVIASEHLKVDAGDLKALCECGDVRSALNGLEFYVRSRSGGNPVARTNEAALFYALGKIVYGSSEPSSVYPAVERFKNEASAFNLTVLENYCTAHKQQLRIGAAANAAEWLSIGDTTQLGVNAALGVSEAIGSCTPDPSLPPKFIPLKYSQHVRWNKEKAEFRRKIRVQLKNNGFGGTECAKREEQEFTITRKRPVVFMSSDSEDDF